MHRTWIHLVALVGLVGTAHADNRHELRRVVVPRDVAVNPADKTPNVIFLNRCKGGCIVKGGTTEDARTQTSTILKTGSQFTINEFAWGDAEWNQTVQCIREVWSPYGVTITDVQPDASVDYSEGIVAGTSADAGLGADILGIAMVTGNCNPVDHAISFSFANMITTAAGRVNENCWTAAQEIAHNFGLDHSYEYFDHSSACNDPMTYRRDCGGEKFFRPITTTCGEDAPRPCRCGNSQNTHKWLTTVLGTATPITTATSMITMPANNTTIQNGATIHATGSAQRGVFTMEFRLNGYPWKRLDGAPFGPDGQPASDYAFTLPANVPDGVIDIEAVAIDDLGISASSKVTVTKGQPCATEDTCLEGQHCGAGKCFWDPPTGNVGDVCTYDQFCVSANCEQYGDKSYCSQDCHPGAPGTCPDNLECVANGANTGKCLPPVDGGGCCSTGSGETPWAMLALSGLVVGFVVRRRR